MLIWTLLGCVKLEQGRLSHRLGGPADQLVEDLLVSADATAWVQVSSHGGEGEPAPELRIGGHRLDEPGSYLLDVVP